MELHDPFSLQLFGHVFCEQSKPENPSLHKQVPFTQFPLSEQLLGQVGSEQSIPANPTGQIH